MEAALAAVTRALAACDDPALAAEFVAERRALREELAEMRDGANVISLLGRR